ncbi:MAG: site-2 protease family protein, partial [Clostridia bacterium]|nr:site-2 protease family protein [Clostridia bacterium]
LLSILGQSGSLTDALISLLLSLPVILFALCFHETAHGWMAWKCGDDTAYNLGRLTLNPLKHLHPVGAICMLVFGYGWAKPVPVNVRNFRNYKRGMALTAAAGPCSNLILGLIGALVTGVCNAWYSYLYYAGASQMMMNVAMYTCTFFYLTAIYNFLLMAFNMIPVPPFDGSRLALVFLPDRAYFGIMRYERQIMFGILIAMVVLSRFGFSPFGWIAEKLTDLIASPVGNACWKYIFFPMLKPVTI